MMKPGLILIAIVALAVSGCTGAAPLTPAAPGKKGCEPLNIPRGIDCPAEIKPGEVHRALMSAEYYRQYGKPGSDEPVPWLMSPEEATATIVCDTEFGCDRRWFETSETLIPLLTASNGAQTQHLKSVQVPSTSSACCSEVDVCKVARAKPGRNLSAVQFDILIHRDPTTIPEKIDPQTWDDARGSPFEIAYLGKDCSEMNDSPESGFPEQPGEAWTGVIRENYEFATWNPLFWTRFRNALQVSAAKGTIPGEGKETVYRMDYGLCDEGNFEARIPGSGSYKNGLKADCGFSKMILPGSKVIASKKLVFSNALCEGNCERAERHFNISQAILPFLTAASLCNQYSVPARCVRRYCPTTDNLSRTELRNMCTLEE